MPAALQANTMDTLSALVQLMRRVEQAGRCDTHVRTYDGRRVLDIAARTGGQELLEPAHDSIYRGQALRCDFEGSELAGFLIWRGRPGASPTATRFSLVGAADTGCAAATGADRVPNALVRTYVDVPYLG